MIHGIDVDALKRAIEKFKGVKYRLELVRKLDGVSYYDDTPGTNVAAVRAALESFNDPIILIAGGKSKGTDFSELAPIVRDRVKALILIGESKNEVRNQVAAGVQTQEADTLESAVQLARNEAKPGDVVLLSPMCASFDMFRDYQDRGEQFRKYVEKL